MTKTPPDLTPFEMPIGRYHEQNTEVYHPDWRTEKQFETVRRITQRTDFDYACMRVFGPAPIGGRKGYRSWFVLSWCDKNGDLHGTKISGKGKIVQSVVAHTDENHETTVKQEVLA